jgi:hypothetical protein
MTADKRRAPRFGTNKRVQITYIDAQGQNRFETVPAHDISATGCRLTLQFRCQSRAVVAFSLGPARSGSATIRYQTPTPRGYMTGLEFLGGMRIVPATLLGETTN